MLDLWILTHRRVGDLHQMRALAAVLEARVVEKQIRFSNPRLARTIPFLSVRLMDENSALLTPPWPDLVLVAEGAVGSISLEVRRRSGGKTKVVCLGRPRGRMSEFDLIITTPQFSLAPAPNVLELTLPLHRLDRPAMERAAALLRPQLSGLARPWTVLLVGGTSAPDILDQAAAFDLAKEALVHARKERGSLIVVTSPRTGATAEHALVRALEGDARICLWSQASSDDYPGYLQLGDNFIVTSDSVSMVTEALMTGKPVEIYRLPQRLNGLQQLIARIAQRGMPLLRELGFNSGLLEERPARQRLFDRLTKSDPIADLCESQVKAAKTRLMELVKSG